MLSEWQWCTCVELSAIHGDCSHLTRVLQKSPENLLVQSLVLLIMYCVLEAIAYVTLIFMSNNTNKSAQSNLGRGPRRGMSHMYAVKSPWRAPNLPPKVPLSMDKSANPTTCLIPGPIRPMMPNGIQIRSAVFPQCTGQTDAQMNRPTDRPRESLITVGRWATRAMRLNNNNNKTQ